MKPWMWQFLVWFLKANVIYGGLLGTADQAALDCGESLHGPRLAGTQAQCTTQLGQRAIALLSQAIGAQVLLGLPVEFP